MIEAYVIYGPPGTGKSTELLRRMQDCIERGIPKDRIGFVSFTKAAATELANRVGIKAGGSISTLHSLAFRLAGILREQVIDRTKLLEFSQIAGIEIAGANPEDADYLSNGDAYLALYQLFQTSAKARSSYATMYKHSPRPGELGQFVRFCEGMDKFKTVNGYVDFNDMIKRARGAICPDIDVLFVDEAQDLSTIQWQLIYYWCDHLQEIHVAGDDDQSIYVWGGADLRGIQKFERKFRAKRIVLDQSYRVPILIHSLAQKIITRVKDRVAKQYDPTGIVGELNRKSSVNMLDIKHGEDVLILFRNHFLRREIENHMLDQGIPYVVDSGNPGHLHSFSARAVQSWETLVKNWDKSKQIRLSKSDYNNLLRNVKSLIKFKLEQKDLDTIINYKWDKVINASAQTINYFRKIYLQFGSLNVVPTVHLSTIHGSKGREAEHVVLINGMSNRSVEAMLCDPDSEYRIFYVGITRAKYRLDILQGENPLNIL